MRYLAPVALAPAALALVLSLSACGSEPANEENLTTLPREDAPPPAGVTPPREPGSRPAPAAPPLGDDSVNDGYPDLTPPPLTPEAERTETGARNVLHSWMRAIELEEYDQARALMSDTDRAKWSRSEWIKLFADLDRVTVAAPDGTMEGAAGSSYYTAPVTITASDADGRPVRYEGEVVLRRINDVPGATPEQLRWHIDRVTLDWTH